MDEEINSLLTTWGLEAYIDIFANSRKAEEVENITAYPLLHCHNRFLAHL